MSKLKIGLATGIILVFFSCATKKEATLFYSLNDFNLPEAKAFVAEVNGLPQINSISILNAPKDSNSFTVNGRHIFNDTVQAAFQNFYSYKKFADDNQLDGKKLNQLLLHFDRMKVSEYVKDNGKLIFPVEVYALAKQTGYVYVGQGDLKTGDTIPCAGVYGKKIILKKQLENNWFQYESLQ